MGAQLTVSEIAPKIIVTQTSQPRLTVERAGNEFLVITQDVGDTISLHSHVQNLTVTYAVAETLIIHDQAAHTLIISEEAQEDDANPYGQPYFQAEDTGYTYFSWAHSDGTQWRAQRFDNLSLDIAALTGPNPQPATLSDFQNLSF